MKSMKFPLRIAFLTPILLGLGGCLNFFGLGEDSVPPSERQLPSSAQAMLAIKGMTQDAPIFIRIFKEESELEVWKLKDGRFQLFRTYPICAWSGGLGPKVQQGDRQAPEGFYTVSQGQMNPKSLYYLAFNLGFPNSYDKANAHTGSALMVHGNCKSVGCYAMTDAYIEEIYILAREAFAAGQTRFHVHAFPFRMTAENMQRHKDSPWYGFWTQLKEGYDAFEATGKLPTIKVCSKQYLVNVRFTGRTSDPAPDQACPTYTKLDPVQGSGFDGIPQTVLANYSKSAPSVIAASYQPTAPEPPKVVTAAMSNGSMSASPVIEKPAQPKTKAPVVIADAQPAKQDAAASPQVPAQKVQWQVQPAPYKVAAMNLQGQPQEAPVTMEVQPIQAYQNGSEPPTKTVDPDALQKPNRSGKGGKLSVQPAQ